MSSRSHRPVGFSLAKGQLPSYGGSPRVGRPCYAARIRVRDLRTPAALVDIAVLERNAARMGATAARPGNYAFSDAAQMAIGNCVLEDVAFSVLVTVIGRYPERSELLVDGGALALSRDPGPVHVDPACGFGVVCAAGPGFLLYVGG